MGPRRQRAGVDPIEICIDIDPDPFQNQCYGRFLPGCESLTITKFLQPNLRFGINGKGGWQRIECQPATPRTPLYRTSGVV